MYALTQLFKELKLFILTWLRQEWAEMTFATVLVLALIADILLVTNGHTSISATIWDWEKSHPTIISFGCIGSFCICYWLRKSWVALTLAAMVAGHLFIHY